MKSNTVAYRKQLREICDLCIKPNPKAIGGQGIFTSLYQEQLSMVIDAHGLSLILDEYDEMEYRLS